ncbi:MAG: hypothetical protein Q8R86_03675 [Sulfuricurvum sp.]|nr:hypothetical protein [Sulfuricurvum sp.]
MERRKFLRYSVAAAVALPGIVSLNGCGGGGGGSAPVATVSATDTSVASISTLQSAGSIQRAVVNVASANLLTAPSSTPASVSLASVSSNTFVSTASVFTGNTGVLPATIPTWQAYLDQHNSAYAEATNQITKLKASLRLHGYKQKTSGQAGVQSAAALQLASATTSTGLDSLVESLTTLNLSSLTINLFTVAIEGVIAVIQIADGVVNYSYATAAFNAIEKILKWIQEKSLSNISLASNTDIVLSLGKMSIAVVSALGIAGLKKIEQATTQVAAAALTTQEQQELQALLQAASLQSQLILTLTSFIDSVMSSIMTSTQERIDVLATAADGTYTLTDDDNAFIASLNGQSLILGSLGIVMKILANVYPSETDAQTVGVDAQTFAFLFNTPEIENLVSDVTFSEMADALTGLGLTTGSTPSVTIPSVTAPDYLASAGDMPTQAVLFASHMADLAYAFTTKTENDAYTFAMQGMEYGYLFASRGEEVGLMADRILWMAVQIGVMADRIGEMADRIVYTEQLIVYTEMLILDFGLLIYGGMKQISNVMLMGMAIVFDRQWYTPASEDQIITVIGGMTQQMLANMQEYELTVLNNQVALRESTLKALDWIQGDY